MKARSVIAGLILYIASTAMSFGAFSFVSSEPTISGSTTPPPVTGDGLAIDPGAPKTEVCPLNGERFTETERQAWEERRPLLVMIENSEDARPQSGLSRADIIYEAVAEGGVTRFMGIFYCDAIDKDINLAPVRSARTHFITWASEYSENPLYAHVGGANCSADKLPSGGSGPCKTDKRVQALEQIESYGWGGRLGNDMNQFSIGYPTFYRDYNRLDREVATEHTMVSSTEKLWDLAKTRGWTNVDKEGTPWTDSFEPWKFKDEATAGERGQVKTISFDFWEGFKKYDARWEYNSETNSYARFTGGEPHKDLETSEQLQGKNIVVQLVKEEGPVDELKHMYYETIGRGDALIFNNGTVTEARWSKPTRTDRTIFTDKKGDVIEFVRGKIWIQATDVSTKVAY